MDEQRAEKTRKQLSSMCSLPSRIYLAFLNDVHRLDLIKGALPVVLFGMLVTRCTPTGGMTTSCFAEKSRGYRYGSLSNRSAFKWQIFSLSISLIGAVSMNCVLRSSGA